MKYPNKLREVRDRTPKSQQDLADALKAAGIKGAKKQKIWKIERGIQRMTPEEVAVFAKVLECDIYDILPGTGSRKLASSPVRRHTSSEAPHLAEGDISINYSLDDLLYLYERTDPKILKMFNALRPILEQSEALIKKK